MTRLRVLYANHTAELAGAERQLLEMIEILEGAVEPLLACPNGELAFAARSRGIDVAEIPETTVSLRPHPIHTLRGLAQITRSGAWLRRLSRVHRAELIHANTERAGLAAAIPGVRAGRPLVAHAHTPIPSGRLGNATARVLARSAAIVVANSRYTAKPLLEQGAVLEVAPNPIDPSHFTPACVDGATARAALGVPSGRPVIAVIGYLAPIKRQDDAIRALARVRESHPDTELVIAGGTRFTAASARDANAIYAHNLRGLAAQLDLQNSIHFVGERADVREVLAIADVLLVPSLSEGFGRVVLEAMAMAVPVIATSVGGPSEIITDGLDGFLLDPSNPELWGARTAELLADPECRRAVGERARERASRDFTPSAFRSAILTAYERAFLRA